MTSHPVIACRMCQSSRLEPFLDLGMTPLADAFVSDPFQPEMTYPLAVLLCMDCGLAQLSYVVDAETLYDDSYVYEASATVSGRQHFADLAQSLVSRFGRPHGYIVDIGCNDGVLLDGFEKASPTSRVYGIDPALTVTALARSRSHEVYTHVFDPHAAGYVRHVMNHEADIITATNVFAHVDDLENFIEALDILLAPEGVFVIEAPYFRSLVDGMEYDTIYHEHLSYLSVDPVERFFRAHGLRLFDVEAVGIHGGSLRYYVDRGFRNIQAGGVQRFIAEERGALDLDGLKRWATKVHEHQRELVRTLERYRGQGMRLAGVSAPAKGMTLLNTSHAGDLLEFLTEKPGGLKVGRYAPGSRLEVKDDSALVSEGIDCALILAWNFAEDLVKAQRGYEGAFLRPIPTPERVGVVA